MLATLLATLLASRGRQMIATVNARLCVQFKIDQSNRPQIPDHKCILFSPTRNAHHVSYNLTVVMLGHYLFIFWLILSLYGQILFMYYPFFCKIVFIVVYFYFYFCSIKHFGVHVCMKGATWMKKVWVLSLNGRRFYVVLSGTLGGPNICGEEKQNLRF